MMPENHHSSRQAILVLGMHRSGTSAVSGVLARLGVQPPKTLIPPASDNPSGFWESKEIVAYHERLLASIGSAWSDWSEIDCGAFAQEPANGQTSLSTLIDQEFGEENLFFVKDPRMCRLTDVWLRTLTEKKIKAKAIMPIRHPTEVARSLKARNRFGTTRSYLIWLRHVLDAEHGTRRISRVVVQYSKLMVFWREEVERIMRELSLEWPIPPVRAGVEQYLNAELRHHSEGFDSTGHRRVDDWVRRTYELLQQIGQEDEDNAMQNLDDIRSEFNVNSSAFAQAFREAEATHVETIAKLRKQLQAKAVVSSPAPAEMVVPMGKKLAEVEAVAREERDAHLTRVSEIAWSIRADAERHHAVLATLASELQAKSEQVVMLESQVRAQDDELVAIRRRFEQSSELYRQESVRRKAVNAELEKIVSDQRSTIHSHKEKLRDALCEIGQLKRRVDDLKRTNESDSAMLRKGIERQRRASEELARELDTLRGSRGWALLSLLRRVVGRRRQPKHASGVLAEDVAAIRDSGMFDQRWYLDSYPDVAKSGMDPIEHYLRYGVAELRDPSPEFDTASYLERNPDVLASGFSPLMHYIHAGMGDSRVSASGNAGQQKDLGN